jgi:quercetin dioxygenase-like cupin family protein
MSTLETTEIQTLNFIEGSKMPLEQVADGVSRKILCYDKNLMMVRVEFEKGAIGTLHTHPHIQMTFIESGSFEVEISGEKRVLSAGDVFYVHSNLVHGVVCLEKGVLMDMFNPMREDFIK